MAWHRAHQRDRVLPGVITATRLPVRLHHNTGAALTPTAGDAAPTGSAATRYHL